MEKECLKLSVLGDSGKLFLFADLVWWLEVDLKFAYFGRYRGDKPLTILWKNLSFRNQQMSPKDSEPTCKDAS